MSSVINRNIIRTILLIHALWMLSSCESASNRRAIKVEDLDRVQAGEAQDAPASPLRDALNATEFMSLAECQSLPCVQRFMKDYSSDFVHASKGEFAALHRSVVIDTAGNELIMPLSTIYVDVNPQASWRLAHTLHRPEQAEALLNEFRALGFAAVDSGNYRGQPGKQVLYRSAQYPARSLYVRRTFEPWRLKGLYRRVTWPCTVFEIYNDQ